MLPLPTSHLTPLASSLNASVVAHRRLIDATLSIVADIGEEVVVWLPVLTEADPPALAALLSLIHI